MLIVISLSKDMVDPMGLVVVLMIDAFPGVLVVIFWQQMDQRETLQIEE
jgi:hypothetical protein